MAVYNKWILYILGFLAFLMGQMGQLRASMVSNGTVNGTVMFH